MKQSNQLINRYNPTPISGDESQSMRGIAILCIMFHNFLHLILPTVENEFSYDATRIEAFTHSLAQQPAWAMADIMSFLGWYGVAVFIFLSGYGLVRKFECGQQGKLNTWQFIKNRWVKVFKLMLIPMLIFAAVWSLFNGKLFYIEKLLMQLALIGNIGFPTTIQPGVYWFFGLIFELYIFYRLCIYRRSMTWIIATNIIAFAIFVGLWLFSNVDVMSAVRHNFIGWVLPFTLGAVCARYDISRLFQNRWINIAIVASSGIVLTLMNYNPYLWYISPVVAIIAAIALVKLWRGGQWLGVISSSLFAIHPIVRYIAIQPQVKSLFGINDSNPYSIEIIPLLAIFIALSILLATLYTHLHRKLFARK